MSYLHQHCIGYSTTQKVCPILWLQLVNHHLVVNMNVIPNWSQKLIIAAKPNWWNKSSCSGVRNRQLLQWCQIENQQSPVYVVNSHFSRRPDGYWGFCHNFDLLIHLCHVWELYNVLLYDPVPKGVSKIQPVKVESSTFIKWI